MKHLRTRLALPSLFALLATTAAACAVGDSTYAPPDARADASRDAPAFDAVVPPPDAPPVTTDAPVTTDTADAPVSTDAPRDAPLADAPPDAPVRPVRCGDGACTAPTETCTSCPLDCSECPRCDMAPTCTGALAVPTSVMALPECNNDNGTQRSNYACGTMLGVVPNGTSCADPQLRLRLRELSIRRGFFDIPKQFYCAITAEDGAHSELMITTLREAAGNRSTTRVNFRPTESVFWGQADLFRSIANITVTYSCYIASNADTSRRVLEEIAGRAGTAAAHADGYGWVFGTVSVLGTVIGSALSTERDTQVLDVQQTISASALLTMTNGRTWEIHQQHGNLDLSGAADMRLQVDSWGCADVRTRVP